MARKLRSALMAEGEFVDGGLSAFGEDNDITRELTRSLLHGHAVPGLEATFQALTARHEETESRHYLGDSSGQSDPAEGSGTEAEGDAVTVVPSPAVSAGDENGHARQALPLNDEAAAQRLAALRAAKQAALARRTRRVTVERTLAGHPGQLSLFELSTEKSR